MNVDYLDNCGAEVTGVDLSRLNTGDEQQLRQAFADTGLLLIRDQHINEAQHRAFAKRWGSININRFFEAHPEHPDIAMVRKEPDQEINIGEIWHTDHSYDQVPALGSVLVARELPQSGGDTCFASMYRACEGLSEGLRSTLLGLRAVHSARHVFGSSRDYDREAETGGRLGNASAADALEDAVHPVIIEHPLSGKPALYVNPQFTVRFEGWTREESLPLLEYLYEHATRDEYVTRFHWEPGSIAFWDNRATWHRALNDYHGQRRVMHRITLDGCSLEGCSLE